MNSPTPTPAVSPAKVAVPVGRLATITAAALKSDPDQPRKEFEQGAMDELTASIKAQGLIQPITVRPNGTGYIVVDGDRRYRACLLAGVKELPVYIREDLRDTQPLDAQLVANLQRADLTMAEQCEAVARLVKTKGHEATARLLGKSPAWVSKRASSTEWPAEVKTLVAKGKVVDVEIASGLAQLAQVSPKRFKVCAEDIAECGADSFANHRDDLAQEVKWAKDKIKSKEEQAQAAAKAAKTGKPVDPYAEKRRKEADQKKARLEKWAAIKPTLDAVAQQARKATGAEINSPRVYEYAPEPAPASAELAKFNLQIGGDADKIKKFVSKTGLTLKLDCHERIYYTVEQAVKIEAIFGRKMRWGGGGDLAGKQLMALAAKCGSPIKLPDAAPAKKVEAKPAKAAAKKAKR